MAKDSDGWSGLCLALFDDQIDTAKAYLDCILVSTLDVKQKIELLTAQDRHGKSGLYAAFQHTHTDTAAIYMRCLIDTKLLTDAQKIDLFSKLVSSEQFKEILPLNTSNQYIYDALQSIELRADKKNAMKSELRSMIKESLNGAEDETKSSDVDEEPPIFQ
jgi:hypothetical protein